MYGSVSNSGPRPRYRLWHKHKSILYALHPNRLPAEGIRLTYTFGLGGIAVLTTLITILTGLLLTFYYQPTPEHAYASVVLLEDVVVWGSVVRALHYWAAQLMVVTATLHMARVLFTGAYARPRRFNWLVGWALLILTLLWDFSGYVLRWDNHTHWALLVGTNLIKLIPGFGHGLYRMLVGDEVIGAPALLRFYTWHVIGLTLVVVFGIVYHLFRLRVDGGISRPPRRPGQPRVMVGKELLFQKEIVAALLITGGLILAASLFPAPLGNASDLGSPPAEAKAPWIFLWIQRLLRWLPAPWAGMGIPLLVAVSLALLPWLVPRVRPGTWFDRRQRLVQSIFGLGALLITLLTLWEALG
ncbi:MAG TPA: cytochrome bc complex cytochrome b subunit [Anaerolineae bacterium]|nr:cytochrome bc complex cytochrome b subunit [Anaerolineae bacterium]HIQ06510.1 cytochrome bc complex cytochrome b subunit [Anaerolineae bacterium]